MDGSGLMESLLNSIKPLNVAVVSLTANVQVSFQDHRIIESADILRVYKVRVNLWISYFFDDITTFLGP